MAIVNTSQHLTGVTYARGETITITNGATLTVTATPAVRTGTVECTTTGELLLQNSSPTVPLLFDLDDMNNDFRFESAGVFKIRGAPLSLGVGTGGAQTWDFTVLFGGVIKDITYAKVEEVAGSGVFMPWAIIPEDPKFNLNTAGVVNMGGAAKAAFSAGNTPAGRVLFWHETNRTLSCGDNTNGMAVPSGCAVIIPNTYVSNRLTTNATRVMALITQGTPTGGTFTIELKNEAGTVLGTTVALNHNATLAAIDAALETITGAGTVTSTGGPLPALVRITWAGALTTGFGDFPSARIASSSLTGGTNPVVLLYEDNTANLSTIDLNPLGSLDAEWCCFSPKIRVFQSNFKRCRLHNVGFSSDVFRIENSNGPVDIDGFSLTFSPFALAGPSQVANVFGDVSIKNFVGAVKNPVGYFNITNLPRLQPLDRLYWTMYGKRTATTNGGFIFSTLPADIKITNITSVGVPFRFTNLISPKIVNYAYADGALSGPQETAQVMHVANLVNCIDPLFANVSNAGPQSARGLIMGLDNFSSNVQVLGGTYDMGNSGVSPVYLSTAGAVYKNILSPNVRIGPMVELVNTSLANNSIVQKVFSTFATAETAGSIDASTGGKYDLVTSSVNGIAETFSSISDFVGGNYTDPSLTPTTGHVTFGPFAEGEGMELTGAGYTNALGGLLLPQAGDTATATMTFAMHGITAFQNDTPRLYVDAPGVVANVAVVAAPGAPTGGTFTISVFDSAGVLLGTTAALAFNATTGQVDLAIEGIAGIGVGVTVTGALTAGYVITFPTGQVRSITVNGSLLTGGLEPGIAYAVGRARLLTGTETLGTTITSEFAMRVPGTAWPAYQTLNGANLAAAIPALVGYAPGGSGLEMRLKFTTPQTNPLTQFNQISLLTNVNPALWSVGDASFEVQGPSLTDVVRVVRASDLAVLYSFTGPGVHEFNVGANFDTPVFFRRELASGTVVTQTLPATQPIAFGDNGIVPLFYGAEIQLAQTGLLDAINTLVQANLDVAVSTRLATAGYTAPTNTPTLAQIEASTVLAKEATVASRASQTSVDAIPTNPLLEDDPILGNLDVAVSTRLASSAYTAPSTAPTAAANAAAVRTELTTELGRMDVAVSTRLATAGYTAPPNAPDIADAVLAAAAVTPIHSEMRRTNGQDIIGDGTESNKFRSSLVG